MSFKKTFGVFKNSVNPLKLKMECLQTDGIDYAFLEFLFDRYNKKIEEVLMVRYVEEEFEELGAKALGYHWA